MQKMKKKILSWLIVLSIIIVGINILTGIIQTNQSSEAFGIVIENQTEDEIKSIRLMARVYGKNSGKSFENDIVKSFQKMVPGTCEEFVVNMNYEEEQCKENTDIIISVKINENESYSVQEVKGVPIKEGKRSIIKLIGNKLEGFKAEFVEIV